jgi:hypothetical protein
VQVAHGLQLCGQLGVVGVERERVERVAPRQVGSSRIVGRDAGVQVPQDRVPVGQLVEPAPLEGQFVAEQEVDGRADLADHVVPRPSGQPHDGVSGAPRSPTRIVEPSTDR